MTVLSARVIMRTEESPRRVALRLGVASRESRRLVVSVLVGVIPRSVGTHPRHLHAGLGEPLVTGLVGRLLVPRAVGANLRHAHPGLAERAPTRVVDLVVATLGGGLRATTLIVGARTNAVGHRGALPLVVGPGVTLNRAARRA